MPVAPSARMAQPVDPYAGQSGSYIREPGGPRRLVFRTGIGPAEPIEDAAEAPTPAPAPAPKPARKV